MPLYQQKHEDSTAGIQPLGLASTVARKQTNFAISFVALFCITFLSSTTA